MEVVQSKTIPNPNKSKNRIPRRAELAMLHSIRIQKRQLASTIADQVLQAREAHAQIQARYDDLLQEIEALQSALTISQKHLNMLEKQQQIIQEEEDELAGLLHPIRRCPEDILRVIFTYTTQCNNEDSGKKKNDSFQIATNISHVCRFWRAVALEMGSLWKYLSISTKDDIKDVKSFIERTKPRTQTTPVIVEILEIGRKSKKEMKELIDTLHLDQFVAIQYIYISLNSPKDIDLISQAVIGTALAVTEFLWVVSESSTDDPQSTEWDFSWLLRQPKLYALQLEVLGTIIMTGTDSFPSLTEIHLHDVCIPSLVLQLPRLPSLKELAITGDFQVDLDPLAHGFTMENLSFLKVEGIEGFPWHQIIAPQLRDVTTNDEDPIIVPFLCRHPSIRFLKLDTYLTEEGFKSLAIHLNNMETLDVAGALGGLVKQVGPEVPFPPFPRLRELSIELGDDFSLSSQDAEDFIKIRRLPNQEGEIGNISLLSRWTISGKPEFLEHAPWRTSSLLSDSEQTFAKSDGDEPWSTLTLHWSN